MKAHLVVTAVVVLGLAASCGETQNVSAEKAEPFVFDVVEYQRTLVACYEDRGVDARPFQDGVRFDENGTLTSDETFALADECEEELIEKGVIPEVDMSEEALRLRYDQLVDVRACLVELGYPIPDLPSVDVFLEAPDTGAHPYDYLVRNAPDDFPVAEAECPDDV